MQMTQFCRQLALLPLKQCLDYGLPYNELPDIHLMILKLKLLNLINTKSLGYF